VLGGNVEKAVEAAASDSALDEAAKQTRAQALRADFGMTRYQASALLSFQFNKSSIQRLVVAANDAHREAA
jgi:acetamidase/formamidase